MRQALRRVLQLALRRIWQHMRRILPPGARSARAVLAGLGVGVAGCGGDTVQPYVPTASAAQLYLRLSLNYGAVTLSTTPGYETFQLVATPLNALGEPMAGLPAPTFRSTDTTRVKVSPTGLMTALKTGTKIFVIAELTTSDNIYHVDTAYINVNATTNPPPVLATVTINPVSPDSAIRPVSGISQDNRILVGQWVLASFPKALRLPTYLKELDAGGTALPNLQTEYFSLDSTVARVDRRTGAVGRVAAGRARLIARTVAYGIAKADTTVFAITPPISQGIAIRSRKIFETVAIRQSGYVYWTNEWQPVGVVFDNPASVSVPLPTDTVCTIATTGGSSGSAAASPRACDADFSTDTTQNNGYRIRKFSTPGTYTYRDTLSGEVGKVIVLDSTAWSQ